MSVEDRLRRAAHSLDESIAGRTPTSLPSTRGIAMRRLAVAGIALAVAALIAIPAIRRGIVTDIETTDQPGQRGEEATRSGEEGGGGPTEPGTRPGPGSVSGKPDGGQGTRPASGSSVAGISRDRVAFMSNRDGNSEIYTMNTDGSSQTRLTSNSAGDGEPAWSPSGDRIAFASNRDGKNAIYVMKSDGSGQSKLISVGGNGVNVPDQSFSPAWSPDGTRIAFVAVMPAGPTKGKGQIWLTNADGSDPRQLTFGDRYDSRAPSWSPDGTRIVFARTTEGFDFGDDGLWVMSADGSDMSWISYSQGVLDRMPAWSPDGKQIAFINRRRIMTMRTDGGDRKALTDTSDYDAHPSWSSDGSQLFFDRDPDGNYGFSCGVTTEEAGCPYVVGPMPPSVWRMNADGTGLRTLSNNMAGDWWPAFGRPR